MVAATRAKEDDSVKVLTTADFDEFLAKNTRVFVKFYAPWCGHCKTMAPAYASLAKRIEAEQREVAVVKVDGAAETALSQRFGVQGYPTLKLFVDGVPIDYKGAREEKDMYNWLVKKSGPAAVQLTPELAEKADSARMAVILLLPEGQKGPFEDFEKLAGSYDDIPFYYSHDNAFRERYDAHDDFVLIVNRSFDDGRKYLGNKEPASLADMRTFVEALRYPLVAEFDQETAERIFGNEKAAIFLFGDNVKKSSAIEAFREAAKTRAQAVVFAISSITADLGAKLADFIGVTPADEGQLRIIKFAEGGVRKYKCGTESAAVIEKCVDDFSAGQLSPYYKSEPVPPAGGEPVRVVVGDNFQEVVLDSPSHVLLEAYAPWCGHCKKLAPIYEKLAAHLASQTEIVVAKMDATANEHPSLEVRSFPVIKLYKKGSKDAPVDFEGDRTFDGMLEFLARETGLALNATVSDEL